MKYKFLYSALLYFTSIIFLSHSVFAQADVSTDVIVNYEVDEGGVTFVNYEISLRNIFTDRYAKSYTLQLDGTSPTNINVTEEGNPLEFTTSTFDNTKAITVSFPNAIVGQGRSRTFSISYQDDSLVNKSGEVWDVSIPRLGSPDEFKKYDVYLKVPETFGDPAYVSPQPKESSEDFLYFDKNLVSSAGIHAAFGSFQVYEVKLSYDLDNPIRNNAKVDISLPPDTAYQRVYLNTLEPQPESLVSDEDGNWIATYDLKPREQITVNLNANIQVFNSPIRTVEVDESTLEEYLKPTQYWQSDNPQIQTLAKKHSTPRDIYNYIVRNFEYNHNRVLPNADRLGAVAAINNPSDVLCMEFTDTFIAIARAAGIPARELNGYAYSDNSNLQPLSLVSDVLHSWPEYWDDERKTWIAVDPTWENTTGGIDYFNTMDLKHIVFTIHGLSDTLPYPAGSYKLGAFPEKNVEVNIGTLPSAEITSPSIEITTSGGISLLSQTYSTIVRNPNPTALYNVPLTIDLGKKQEVHLIEAVLPLGSARFVSRTPVGFLASDIPSTISATSGSVYQEFSTRKNEIALYHSASVLLVILAITGGVAIFVWKRS